MPSQDEILRIIFEVQNQNKVAAARAELEDGKAAIAQLDAAMRAGTISQAAYAASMQRVGQNMASARAQMAQAQAALAKLNATGGGGGAKVGGPLWSLGHTLDDLQYVGEQGLRPIINNLMQIHPAVGVAAIAIDQLIKHWEDLKDSVVKGGFIDEMTKQFGGMKVQIEDVRDALLTLGGPGAGVAQGLGKALGFDLPGALGNLLGQTGKVHLPEAMTDEGSRRKQAAEEAVGGDDRKKIQGELEMEAAKFGPKTSDAYKRRIAQLNEAVAKALKTGDKESLAKLMGASPTFKRAYQANLPDEETDAQIRKEASDNELRKLHKGIRKQQQKNDFDDAAKDMEQTREANQLQAQNERKARENIHKYHLDRQKREERDPATLDALERSGTRMARMAIPNADKIGEALVNQLAAKLEATGDFTGLEAKARAKEMVKQGRLQGIDKAESENEARIRQMMGARSQVLGGAGMNAAVQQGVGMNQDVGKQALEVNKQQAALMKTAVERLDDVARNTRGGARF
jgi:hypothetical protein